MTAAWLPLFALVAAAIAEDAVVEITPEPAVAGAQPVVRVMATADPVHVPSCRGVTWEGFDEETGEYAPLVAGPCQPVQPASRIDKSGTRYELDADPGSAQAVRAVVVVGIGCREGQPFPLAKCTSLSVVEGPPMFLKAKPADR